MRHGAELLQVGTITKYVVCAPHYGYEGAGRGVASQEFSTLDEALAFARAVNVYRIVQPSSPDYLCAHLDPDYAVSSQAWDSWEEVREFGWDNGYLTDDAQVFEVITTRRLVS